MRIKNEFPRPIREIRHTEITISDGTRLAARIWLPEDAAENPVPAIVEYLPYRKNDATAARDAIQHPYFAGHGYASIRVDMRGSGDSDGILYDEYLPQEQDDALEVLAWIAAQPWCTGAAGIIGISWGGFNGLQIAARRPPELKAIITLCSTDDRYADDVHYMGGCLLAQPHIGWASRMFANNARPPDPDVVGLARWREMWLDRMARTPPFLEAWLTHQRRDAFWKHGSVCEDYAAITCPVYAVGGWADAYTNAVPRLLEGLTCPRKGLIGPWSHLYPEMGVPGPAIGFLQECLRWWDYWLKGMDTGIMDEPMLRAWMQEMVPPGTHYAERPGRWVAEPAWPSPRIAPRTYWLQAGTLEDEPGPEGHRDVLGAQHAGLDAGVWCPHGVPGDMPPDQRAEDGLSLTFTSAPMTERMEILGFPEAILDVAVDRPIAMLAVRLCDVAPSGASTLVTRGLLNLNHQGPAGHEQPVRLEPGRRYTVTVRLNATAYVLPAGHRWRIGISPTYWPWAWPSSEPVTLGVFTGTSTWGTGRASRLDLPVRPPQADDDRVPPFAPAEGAPPLAVEVLRAPSRHREARRDQVSGTVELRDHNDMGLRRQLATRIEYGAKAVDVCTITEGDPLSARIQCDRQIEVGRGDWQTRVETRSTLSADAQQFHLTNVLDAYEGPVRVFARTWHLTVPRDHV